MSAIQVLTTELINQDDIIYEEDLAHDPFNVSTWWRYIFSKVQSSYEERVFIFERALGIIPASYKIWKEYLDFRKMRLEELAAADGMKRKRSAEDLSMDIILEYRRVNYCYERALTLLSKMPRVWLDYCEFLNQQHIVTLTRRTFDRALQALPVTQHQRIWEPYLEFAKKAGGETALRVFKRYVKFKPSEVEDYLDILLAQNKHREAASLLINLINDPKFKSKREKTKHQLWMELCLLICNHPHNLGDINVEAIIRSGIKNYTDQVGKLWISLAKYWQLLHQFDKARDVYEEGMRTVTTVRDFTQIFDVYASFEESILTAELEASGDQEEDNWKMDLKLARFERLMDRRPFLVNDVVLRQNPHNISEWQNRVNLWKDNLVKVVDTYNDAFKTIHPKKSTGKLSQLWLDFAKFYEDRDNLESARTIFEKGTKVPFKTMDELADIWCEYVEMELRHKEIQNALTILGRATTPTKGTKITYKDDTFPVQDRVFKCLRIWSLYADLEESVGTVESTKAVYERMLELRVATPQTIFNYALYLEENNYFEESFKAYEKGTDIFPYPIAFEIWNTYLTKFIKRYGGSKLDRTRDLFEQALDKCPAKYCKSLYLMYAKLEEDFGLARHVMAIYDRATKAVDEADRFELFNFYIAKATSFFGVTSTREIYEKAIEVLPDDHAKDMSLKYAELERKLGEIDRARAIYAHGSQFCDPRTVPSFWKTWQDFEVNHGNEDTFKEMLRIKRSVQAKYNTEINYISAQMVAARLASKEQESNSGIAHPSLSFIRSKEQPILQAGNNNTSDAVENNNEPEGQEEEEKENPTIEVEQKTIPDAVLGKVAEKLGAKARFQQKQK